MHNNISKRELELEKVKIKQRVNYSIFRIMPLIMGVQIQVSFSAIYAMVLKDKQLVGGRPMALASIQITKQKLEIDLGLV